MDPPEHTHYRRMLAARDELWAYMLALVASQRRHPHDGLLGHLIQSGAAGSAQALNDEELAGIGLLLLIAGHETTANMLALGTYALLSHPDQLRALREDDTLVDGRSWDPPVSGSAACPG